MAGPALTCRVLLLVVVAVTPPLAAQDNSASNDERFSAWLAEKAGAQRRIAGNILSGSSDADAAAAARQIRADLDELRVRFRPRALDVEGLVAYRCFESRAELQLGDIRWRKQLAQTFGPASHPMPPSGTARLPPRFYDHLIASFTTTRHTGDEVRSLASRELSRVHREIRTAMKALGHTGSIERLFDFLRTDDRFFYAESAEGREAYLVDTRRVLAEVEGRLHEIILNPPDAPIAVVRSRDERESQLLPMYAPGGSYLVPLADMRASPRYLLQPIAYHEGMPGHHLQFSVQGMRRAARPEASEGCVFSAYTEGWGLYAERLPYELGLYRGDYADVGRLAAEAWRAARVVVDVGVNVDGWSEGKALAFLLANAPIPETVARIEVTRVRSTPALTTAYLIGKLAIERQRARATSALGPRFDVRAFHDQVLRYGPMPLTALGDVIDRWIDSVR